MKTSMISNLSVASALRMTMSQTQKDLMVAQAESISGKHYDMGVALAGKTAQSLDLNREVDRLAALGTSNSLVATRLSASQASLKSMGESGQQILNTILAFGGNQDANSLETSKTSIKNYVNSIMEKANFSNSGEYLFAGINTDVKPLKDIFTDGSADKAAFDTALDLPGKLTTFMAAQTPPVTDKSQLTEAQMTTFLGQVETTFTSDAFWKANVSNASDTNTQSRITQGEVVQTSVNANDQALRKLVLGSIIAQQFMDTSFSAGARIAVQKTAQNEVYQGMNGVSAMQGKLGLSEERVKKANDSIDAQKKIITTYLGDLEGIDVTAAAARVKNLLQLADASYTLTARIQQLSLVNVL